MGLDLLRLQVSRVWICLLTLLCLLLLLHHLLLDHWVHWCKVSI